MRGANHLGWGGQPAPAPAEAAAAPGAVTEHPKGSPVGGVSTVPQGMVGAPHLLAYTASKFAIRGMTKAAALELGAHNIRVNSIHPGIIRVRKPRPGQPSDDLDYEALGAPLPLGRAGESRDVAGTALFLASDESAYTTGTEFLVDGGMLAGATYR